MSSGIISREGYYKSGDTFEIPSSGIRANFSGLITNGTKTISIMISLPKMLHNISSVTVSSCAGGLRGTSGYIDGTTDSTNLLNNYTITASKVLPCYIQLNIAKSSAFTNVSNNTPVNFNGFLTLQFS